MMGDSIVALPEWHELLGTAHVRNRAQSGTRTDWLAAQRPPTCRVIVLSTGINDLLARTDPAVTRAHLQTIGAALAGHRVIVVPPIAPHLEKFRAVIVPHHPRIHNVDANETTALLTDMRAAMPHATFIDVGKLLGPDGRLCGAYTDDGLHPNGQGYLVLARLIGEALCDEATH
jgi:lysophospholipase L1-like esterase